MIPNTTPYAISIFLECQDPPDHLHDWYPFWDAALGIPVSEGAQTADGAWSRDYSGGTAVYNPPGNKEFEIVFEEDRTSIATGIKARTHNLQAFDGDIYLK